jgi:hypothetical protein
VFVGLTVKKTLLLLYVNIMKIGKYSFMCNSPQEVLKY